MAVTIHNTPEDFTPSDNPVRWTFSSDQTNQPNFAYLVEVFVNNVLTANELVFPDNGIYARFDASAYASTATQPPTIGPLLMEDAANNALIKIRVVERYGTPPVDQASAESANVCVWKARLDDDDFVDWDPTEYIAAGTDKLWLTNYPSGFNPLVRVQNENQRIMAFTDEQTVNITIKLYDSDDNVIASEVGLNLPNPPKIAIFKVDPAGIVGGTSIVIGDFDDCAYYTVETNHFGICRFDINTQCEFEHARRLHFLSEWGTVESFTFELISRHSAQIKSFSYRPSWGTWENEDFNYTKTEGRDIDYAKVSDRMIMIESDWIREDIQHWLIRNLYESPIVYEETLIGGGAKGTHLRRRKILETAWADKYDKNDTLFKEQVTLALATKTSMIV